jgi:hypothetical protein
VEVFYTVHIAALYSYAVPGQPELQCAKWKGNLSFIRVKCFVGKIKATGHFFQCVVLGLKETSWLNPVE